MQRELGKRSLRCKTADPRHQSLQRALANREGRLPLGPAKTSESSDVPSFLKKEMAMPNMTGHILYPHFS